MLNLYTKHILGLSTVWSMTQSYWNFLQRLSTMATGEHTEKEGRSLPYWILSQLFSSNTSTVDFYYLIWKCKKWLDVGSISMPTTSSPLAATWTIFHFLICIETVKLWKPVLKRWLLARVSSPPISSIRILIFFMQNLPNYLHQSNRSLLDRRPRALWQPLIYFDCSIKLFIQFNLWEQKSSNFKNQKINLN